MILLVNNKDEIIYKEIDDKKDIFWFGISEDQIKKKDIDPKLHKLSCSRLEHKYDYKNRIRYFVPITEKKKVEERKLSSKSLEDWTKNFNISINIDKEASDNRMTAIEFDDIYEDIIKYSLERYGFNYL